MKGLDSGHGTTLWLFERWDADATAWLTSRLQRKPEGGDFHAWKIAPYSTTDVYGNLITTAGWTRLMSLLTNQNSTQALTSTAVRIGAGDGSTAETYGDTDLAASAGSTHRYFQPVSGSGTLGTRTLAFAASFGSSDGNFAWSEFGIDVGTPSVSGGTTVNALLFNRKVSSQGTKASGQTWTATATITFT